MGRTHQIRIHFAWWHQPLVGDLIYGKRDPRLGLTRHFLPAAPLTWTLPGKLQTVVAGLTSAEK